jgi:hypothetical protein
MMNHTTATVREVLPKSVWTKLRLQHEERVDLLLRGHVERARTGTKHPVYDFLFDYYRFRTSHLRRWHPGIGRVLQGEEASAFLEHRAYRRWPDGIGVTESALTPERRSSVRWMLALLENCRTRPPQFGCFGLHEWAMVYRSAEVRHADLPLRLPAAALAEVVERLPIRCSHFDAFRFFTPAASPLNRLQPTKASQAELEQRGCLHVNMDLYKWASKLSPYCPSEIVTDTFVLATRIREVDMRASPYDLSAYGFGPICIETPEGRTEYEELQREFALQGEPLRALLIEICHAILREERFNSSDSMA